MNYYFLNGFLNETPTIIETTMYQRYRLLSEGLNRHVRVISMVYSPNQQQAVQAAGLPAGAVMGLFDAVQHSGGFQPRPYLASDYHWLDDYRRVDYADHCDYLAGERVIARGELKAGHLTAVAYLAVDGSVTQLDSIDERGFLGLRQIFNGDQLTDQLLFSPTGQIVVTWSMSALGWQVTLMETGEVFCLQRDLEIALLNRRLPASCAVVSERREFDAVLAALGPQVRKVYRLYQGAMNFQPDPAALVLTRQETGAPGALRLDEFGDETAQASGWPTVVAWAERTAVGANPIVEADTRHEKME